MIIAVVALGVVAAAAAAWAIRQRGWLRQWERAYEGGPDKVAEKMMEDLRIKSMEIRNGQSHLDMEGARELAAIWVDAARKMLGDAVNYTETRVSFDVKIAESPELYSLVVQRHGPGVLTPHEARKKAEKALAEAEREIEEIIRERDAAEEVADELAILAGDLLGIDVGEHSNMNDPRRNAIDALKAAVAAKATN